MIAKIDDKRRTLKKHNEIDVDFVSELLNFTKDIYNTYMRAAEARQKRFIALFFDGFDVQNGVIIKERYSLLFEELIRLEAIIYKKQKIEKALVDTLDSEVITDTKLGAVVEEVRTVFERRGDASIYIPVLLHVTQPANPVSE